MLKRIPVEENAPIIAADEVLQNLIPVTGENMLGVHDAHMAILAGKAYIVYEANDEREGESDRWPFVYCAMSIVDMQSHSLEAVIPFACSGQTFENETLLPGQCFVPRILALNEKTLRVFFVSQDGGKRQEDVWYLDYDIARQRFSSRVHRVWMKTPQGIVNLQPQYHFQHARGQGYQRPALDYALYIFDILQPVDGRIYVVLNNFQGKLNSLGVFNDVCDTIEILGNIIEPREADLSEAGIQRLADGSWLAILRCDNGDCNYYFAMSRDGKEWTTAAQSSILYGGSNSKPILNKFGDAYYMGWQAKPGRTRFNIDISEDGMAWSRAFSFVIPGGTLQYPSLCEYEGSIYLCATGIKDRSEIVFGRLCGAKSFEQPRQEKQRSIPCDAQGPQPRKTPS